MEPPIPDSESFTIVEGNHAEGALRHAFRAPKTHELDDSAGTTSRPNPDLQAGDHTHPGSGVRAVRRSEVSISLSAFHNHINGLITQGTDENGLIRFKNADHVKANGIELELESKWANGLQEQ